MNTPTQRTSSLAEWIACQPQHLRDQAIRSLSPQKQRELLYDWSFWARPSQIQPGSAGAAIAKDDWRFWLALAGRGWGKTRVGAETVRQWAENPKERILMVAPVAADVREVMIEGPSGLMSCYPPNARPIYFPTRHLVSFPSGAVGITRSADEPERLRGPQFTKFWGDELCAWRFIDEAWSQLQFAFRLRSANLRGVITTTPKPLKVLKDLVNNPRTVVTRGSSYENRSNLADEWFADVITPYEGTRLGRQEINAEILEDIPGALWTRKLIDDARVGFMHQPQMFRVVVGVDPAVTAKETSDETGIVAVGLGVDGHVYVLDDVSLRGTPLEWARAAIGVYKKWQADRIVGEVNMGGDLVGANIYSADPTVPFRAVRATRGKMVRAEPVSALYERGRVHHVGKSFELLEDQMTGYVPGLVSKSPDRMDALVWAVTDLLFDIDQSPTLRPVATRVQISRF